MSARRFAAIAETVRVLMPAVARDVAGLAGVASLVYGAWLIYVPAGYLMAGAMLMVGAFAGAKRKR